MRQLVHLVSRDNNQAPFLSLKKEKSQYVWLKVVDNQGKLKESSRRCSGVFIVKFDHFKFDHFFKLVLMFLLLTLSS